LIEPSYGDAPRCGPAPNDNHAPDRVAPGEALRHTIYSQLIANPSRWARTLFVITYDEHGWCFDHVPPLGVRLNPEEGSRFEEPFLTTGPRVPGILVSPFVAPGSVCHSSFDHTSILQLLAERFAGSATNYSAEASERRRQGIRSLSDALASPSDPRTPQAPDPPPVPLAPAGPYDRPNIWTPPVPPAGLTPLQQAFLDTAIDGVDRFRDRMEQKFPGIVAWRGQL